MFGNYHTHTVFCDGKNTAEELVREAIRLGCPEIGFSGHSPLPAAAGWCLTPETERAYRKEILRLREVYAGKIRIFLGIEQDFFSPAPDFPYDYKIGSVHFVKKDGAFLPVDESRESLTESVRRYYGGDFLAFAEDYYQTVSDLYHRTRCDIIGHFDLITKFNQNDCLFDTTDERYQQASRAALKALMPCPAVFEVNYGAVARGLRQEPYPARPLLEEILRHGRKTVFSSDCHEVSLLMFGYDRYEKFIANHTP